MILWERIWNIMEMIFILHFHCEVALRTFCQLKGSRDSSIAGPYQWICWSYDLIYFWKHLAIQLSWKRMECEENTRFILILYINITKYGNRKNRSCRLEVKKKFKAYNQLGKRELKIHLNIHWMLPLALYLLHCKY